MAIAEITLVELASIAAELHEVQGVAWGVSLAAKNAKVISAQAGDKGLGFKPITNFIDEISQQVMKGVQEINVEALKLSRLSVKAQRTQDAYRRFDSVFIKNADAQYLESISPAFESVKDSTSVATVQFRKDLRELMYLLENMNECMLSALAIASVSRIVTADAQEYRAKLQDVANNLEEAAIFIKGKVSDSYDHLYKVNTLLRAAS